MHQLRQPSLALLALLSTLATLPIDALRAEPQRLAQMLAQTPATPIPTFTLQDSVAPGTTLSIDGSPSMAGLNQSLAEGFEQRYPDTDVTAAISSDEQALQALRGGTIDLAALGRALGEAEQDPSLTSIPVTREKIAIIVGRDNPFRGDLTFDDFAAIFRGEITNWSEVGGPNRPIRFIDRPADSSTRLALADYEIFADQPFETGDNAVQVAEDDTAAVVRELGNDGLSYAIASEVLNQDAVRPVSMDGTLPDDSRYPYSQPRNYIYRGEPSLPVEAFLGFATSDAGQAAIEQAKQTASANVTVGANKLPGGLALSPDGRFMVRGSEDGQLQWLDAAGNPTETVIADAHRGAVSAVVVSPDGQTVISSGADGTLRRWDRNGNPLGEPMVGSGGPILALALSPDGQTLASGNANGTVERWSVADGTALGQPIAAHGGPVQALNYPAGGQFLITGSSTGDLGIWTVDGAAAGKNAAAHKGGITAITSSPDGQVITTAGDDGTLRNWDRSTLQPQGEPIQVHDSAISAVAYAPDGKTIATAGTDGTLQLSAPDGTARLPEPVMLEGPAASLGYTPAGQLVVGGSDRTVELRDSEGTLLADSESTNPATDLGNLWQRFQNLPPSAWWMLAAIPALLLLAGIVGSLLGSSHPDDDEDEDEDEDKDTLDADLTPEPGLDIDFSDIGQNSQAVVSPVSDPPVSDPTDRPAAIPLPPEVALVPRDGDYTTGAVASSKLEQARIDLAEGRRLIRENRYSDALFYVNQAIEAIEVERSKATATGGRAQGVNALEAQAQAQRGQALMLLEEPSDAMNSFNAALALDASVIEAWIGKGQLLHNMERYDEALFCFDTALELDPAAVAAWTGKGKTLMQLGRQSDAQTCLRRAATLGGDTALASTSLFTDLQPPNLQSPNLQSSDGVSSEPVATEAAPARAYDQDVPFDLQQMVAGLTSADVDLAESPSASDDDVPAALATEAASLSAQAETAPAMTAIGAIPSRPPITPGPVPPESDNSGDMAPGLEDDWGSGGITAGPVPPDLENDPIAQEHLAPMAAEPTTAADEITSGLPPLRPAPEPGPAPVPIEPGDYVPPPPETDEAGSDSALAGLPPEVMAALASIPPGSPDSFGVVPDVVPNVVPDGDSADEVVVAGPESASWIRLSIDADRARFYAVWQIDADDRDRIKQQGSETMALRLYDVTGRATQLPLPSPVTEQLCHDDFAQDWYLSIPQWDRIYIVAVGYLSPDDDWQAIAQSTAVAAVST
ncbi:substrate-binding domain-containing protein [Nodosilinea sp. LEGE 07088]|nr:substrate-binding domain-containing protein [Nodosilinea sp. LEGE 07088]